MANDTTNIENALRQGARLHAFRSEGGLRVVRVEQNGELLGYGEHPCVEDALAMASRDIGDGQTVYSPHKHDPHFLTGSSDASSDLDAWLLRGATFDAKHSDGEFFVELHGYQELETPKDVLVPAMAGADVEWTDPRGVVLRTQPCQFPSGEMGTSTSVVSAPSDITGSKVWMWESFRLGRSPSFADAFDAAFKAKHEVKAPGEVE